MGLVAYKGILYGGGSDVVANPQDSATDTLTKVGIDGTVYEVTDADAVHTSDIGTANGVAELDANGLVPSSQLPSYVDDVLEYASVSAFPATGETGKIYVALDTNLTYRWSGSAYVEISPSLALGETSSTAYRGDRGKTAYDHATESGRSGAKSAGLYKIGVTAQGHVASATAVAKADLTALGVADQNDVDAIEEDIEGFKTVTGEYITINDAAALPANEYAVTLSPVQNLNGYDSPWVGGAGKNKLAITASTNTINGVTFTVNKDSVGNVLSVKAHGQASARAVFVLWKDYSPINEFIADGQYIMNGCPVGGSESTYQLILQAVGSGNVVDAGAGIALNTDNLKSQNYRFAIDIKSGYNAQNLMFYPMVRLSTVTDSTFAPYSNICPIHGADEVGVRVCGVNLWDEQWEVGVYDSSASTVEKVVDYTHIRSKNPITVESGKTYYMDSAGKSAHLIVADINGNVLYRTTSLNNGTFTVPQNGIYVYFNMAAAYGTTYNNDISINYPSTDTTYHAFNGHSTTITLPSTVYGGSVEQSGEGQVTFGMIDLSTQSTWFSDSPNANGFIRYIAPISGKKSGYNMYCSSFKVSETIIPSTATEEAISGYGGNNNIYLAIDSNRLTGDLTTADGRKAALLAWLQSNTVTVAYELATPTDITVTPFPQTLLEGVNNVWAECSEDGEVIGDAEQSLSYQPQNIVGELRKEIEAKPNSFAQLSDTSFSNLANGQIPKWNSTSQKWENANESGGGGASSLAELSDTNISSPADGQILKWNGTTSKWVNANEYSYTLPAADANTLGGIKVGSRLSIDANGVLSANDQSYTLPTASASTKGGIKVGDNLSMNGEVLSAKTVPWTKVWNYNSGATFTFPSDKTEILLVIRTLAILPSTLASAVYTVGSGQTAYMVAADGVLNGTITLYFTVGTNGNTSIINNTSSSTSAFDFEVWAR